VLKGLAKQAKPPLVSAIAFEAKAQPTKANKQKQVIYLRSNHSRKKTVKVEPPQQGNSSELKSSRHNHKQTENMEKN